MRSPELVTFVELDCSRPLKVVDSIELVAFKASSNDLYALVV